MHLLEKIQLCPSLLEKAKPYSWEIGKVELANVANVEKKCQEIS